MSGKLLTEEELLDVVRRLERAVSPIFAEMLKGHVDALAEKLRESEAGVAEWMDRAASALGQRDAAIKRAEMAEKLLECFWVPASVREGGKSVEEFKVQSDAWLKGLQQTAARAEAAEARAKELDAALRAARDAGVGT